ncbi:MAG: DUF975 family protein [Oscillospiraceae bacterium]
MQINIYELKRQSRETIKSGLANKPMQMTTAVLAYLCVIYLLSILISSLSGYGDYASQLYTVYNSGGDPFTVAYPAVQPAAWVLAAAVFVMKPIMEAGFVSFSLHVTRGIEAGYRTIFDGFGFFTRTLAITLMQTAATYIGLFLFIIPGIYLYYRYRLAVYVMFDHPEMSAMACMRESARLTKGYKMGLFILDISFIGWLLLGNFVTALFLPVLDVYIIPYMGFARAGFYNILAGQAAPPQKKPDWEV